MKASAQRGLSLIELLVGIALGLLTIAVAIGALLVSRSVSSTVSDISQIQQQAAHAFRVMGQQIRQAGSLPLNLATEDPADPVAFETKAGDFDVNDALRGIDKPKTDQYAITVRYSIASEPVYIEESLQRDCLGQNPVNMVAQSAFTLHVDPKDPTKRNLRCQGSGTSDGSAQPVVQNVANFQVRYQLQAHSASTGSPVIRYVNAETVGNNWPNVSAVEVCLVLYGNEAIDVPEDTTYIDCDNVTAVDITQLPAPRTRRTHMVFRNVYRLRSQGVTGANG
ncbi:MAG: prepilin-type cleavage/methylation domain-containing protein [Comamonadaceae bacterium]|nr:MAG: prepilin-type cleavage/methylation domain-containing protein [Comamonadaceae bacterium]